MAGQKGRSGGYRPGAGRKPKGFVPETVVLATPAGEAKEKPKSLIAGKVYSDPKDYLTDYINDPTVPGYEKRQAATALMAYCHPKLGESGKKENRAAAAKIAGKGKFGAADPPKLTLVR